MRERLSVAAIEILLERAQASCPRAQRSASPTAKARYFGSTMITVDVAALGDVVREPCDARAAARVAELVSGDARVAKRVQQHRRARGRAPRRRHRARARRRRARARAGHARATSTSTSRNEPDVYSSRDVAQHRRHLGVARALLGADRRRRPVGARWTGARSTASRIWSASRRPRSCSTAACRCSARARTSKRCARSWRDNRPRWPACASAPTARRVIVSDDGASFEPLTGPAGDGLRRSTSWRAGSPSCRSTAAAPTRAESAWAWFLEGGACEGARRRRSRAHRLSEGARRRSGARRRAHQRRQPASIVAASAARRAAHYEKALALDPEQPEARYNLGQPPRRRRRARRRAHGVDARRRRLPRVRRRALQPRARLRARR